MEVVTYISCRFIKVWGSLIYTCNGNAVMEPIILSLQSKVIKCEVLIFDVSLIFQPETSCPFNISVCIEMVRT